MLATPELVSRAAQPAERPPDAAGRLAAGFRNRALTSVHIGGTSDEPELRNDGLLGDRLELNFDGRADAEIRVR